MADEVTSLLSEIAGAAPGSVRASNPRFFDRVWKVSAFRTGPSKGFVGEHPEWFNPQPNLLEISQLRVQFKIQKHLNKDPNTCELKVTNCNPSTRSQLAQTPLVIRIDAGHVQDAGARHLFTGNLRNGFSKQENNGTDWTTVCELGDGAAMFDGARVNKSFARGTPAIDVIRTCAAAMGIVLPKELLLNSDLLKQYQTGRALYGRAADEMTRLLAPFGYTWSIQDGRFVALRDDQAAPGTALVISQDTGMIGSPTFATPSASAIKKNKPPKLTVKTILYPQVTPGFLVSVQSAEIDGIFRAERVTHIGDSHGSQDWITEVECTAVNAMAR